MCQNMLLIHKTDKIYHIYIIDSYIIATWDKIYY
jgi:hypothetical protein